VSLPITLRITRGAAPPPEPPPVETIFAADWSTATGNTQNALDDGGTWTRVVECGTGIYDIMTVVAGSGVGFTRTTNVLRIQQRGDTFCGNLEVNSGTARPDASESHFGLFFFRNDETVAGHSHPVTYNAVGAIQMVPWSRRGLSEGIRISLAGGGSYPYVWFDAPILANATWFRYEWFIEYVTATTVRIWPRIYTYDNENPTALGTLLHDANDFLQQDYGIAGSLSLAQYWDTGATMSISDVQLARNFGLGNEGPAGSPDTEEYWYIADTKLARGGWINAG